MWELHQQLTGSVTEAIIESPYADACPQRQADCPPCGRAFKVRWPVACTLETLVGPLQLYHPSFYCVPCRHGRYPLEKALAMAQGRKQFAGQQTTAKLAVAVPYETAPIWFTALTGVALGTERRYTLTNRLADGLSVLDVAPSAAAIACAVEAGTVR